MALISVVVPVYNGELTVEETVRSVLNQTFSDFELIVINDGSTDSTPDILSKIQDPRLKVFSYSNAGLSASRNRGIKLASGELISFIDADDLWTPTKLESQLNALLANPRSAISYSWTNCIDASGNLLDFGIHVTADGDVFSKLLKFFFLGSGSNALIRKQVFDEVGYFDETLTSAEDWDMFLRIASQYDFSAVPEPQILYRISDNSMSRNVIRQERESLKVIERAYSREPGKSISHLKKYTYANLFIYLASHALRGAPDRENGKIAARFLWISIKNNPSIIKQLKYVLTLIFKILTVMILPPQQARALRGKVKNVVTRVR